MREDVQMLAVEQVVVKGRSIQVASTVLGCSEDDVREALARRWEPEPTPSILV